VGIEFVESPRDFRDESALVVRVPRGVRSKEKLLMILADKLRLPGYFGGNWDALEDALRDLTWLPAGRGVSIVHEDLPFGAGGENRGHYLGILQSAAEHWATNGQRSFRVVLPESAREAT
jgi:RNAse (barnase) inhibitor barstar